MKTSLLMKDSSEGDCQKEAMLDFILSWTLRVAADDFPNKDQQMRLHSYCREILSKLIFGIENGGRIKTTDKVVSVEVWKQWNRIDLHANIELIIDGVRECHLVVIENKAYTITHDNQLARYKELICQAYDADPYLCQFKKHFILITFLEDNCSAYNFIQNDCKKAGYQCIPILNLQSNNIDIDTESDLFNEFWLREW